MTLSLRHDFPGVRDWHYLDSAATAQKPQAVIDAIARAYGPDYATVHRGVYERSANMTLAYEAARRKVASFIGAASDSEIVYVRGATEGINLVAQCWAGEQLKAGDRILLSTLEHHSNMIDGCQAVPRIAVDVQALDCDFYVFSAHKLYGPTGIGVLWGRGELLDAMPPYQGGGSMIDKVTFEKTTYAPAPTRFEAGTPHITGVVGLSAAIDYVEAIGLDAIHAHEGALVAKARTALENLNSIRVFGPEDSAGILSFAVEGVHPHDVGTILDETGVAIRAGHHCAQPLMRHLGVEATARASFGIYSDESDVDALVRGLERVRKIFG